MYYDPKKGCFAKLPSKLDETDFQNLRKLSGFLFEKDDGDGFLKFHYSIPEGCEIPSVVQAVDSDDD